MTKIDAQTTPKRGARHPITRLGWIRFPAIALLLSLVAWPADAPPRPAPSNQAATAPLKKKSNDQEKLEKNIVVLEQVYVNRLGRDVAYHSVALAKIQGLIGLSKELLVRFVKEDQREIRAVVMDQISNKGIPKELLLKRQEKFLGEIDYIDQLSAALLERDQVRQKEGASRDALKQATDKLNQKNIDLLETQVKIAGKSDDK
jgi:hypothetical protein